MESKYYIDGTYYKELEFRWPYTVIFNLIHYILATVGN